MRKYRLGSAFLVIVMLLSLCIAPAGAVAEQIANGSVTDSLLQVRDSMDVNSELTREANVANEKSAKSAVTLEDITIAFEKPISSVSSGRQNPVEDSGRIESDELIIKGDVTVGGVVYTYKANGAITVVPLANGTGFISTFLGALDGTDTPISISVHIYGDKRFYTVTVGYATETVAPTLHCFGEMFDEMNSLVEAYMKKLSVDNPVVSDPTVFENAPAVDEELIQTLDKSEIDAIEAEAATTDSQMVSRASADTVLQVVECPYYYIWTDEYVQLVSIAAYAPTAVNGAFDVYAKVNGSTQNATYYAYRNYYHGGSINAYASNSSISIETSSTNVQVSDYEPKPNFWSFNVPLGSLIESGYSWIFDVLNLTVNLSSLSYSSYKNSGANFDNSATWDYNYGTYVDWGTGPAYAQNGYGSRLLYMPYNLSYGTTVYWDVYGDLTYSYTNSIGAVFYTGAFTVSASGSGSTYTN